jgi:hypothetical protein
LLIRILTKTKMSSASIQEKIDEYKEQLPDELYRQLCALTMIENRKEKEQEQKEQDFYEVKYAYPSHFYDDDNSNIEVKFKTKIVKLEKKYFDEAIERIGSRGYCFNEVNIRREDGGYDRLEIIKHKHKQIYSIDEDDNRFFNFIVRPRILSIKKA